MTPFNIPYISGDEEKFIQEAIQGKNLAGDGPFTKKCQTFLENATHSPSVLLTTSCTHALELSALLCDIQPEDEIIMSSFTFVSSANAFALRGAKIVFIDISPDTMNMDEKLIEAAITEKTKAILVMHYASIACEMDYIMLIAKKYNLFVIEDAAQCIDGYYKQKHLGTIGHLGAFSFHSTKNIHCGEGGALLINDKRLIKRAEIIREKGTNRKSFLRGDIDKYSWIDIGSSYLMSELNAAFLYAQLLQLSAITEKRTQLWNLYYSNLNALNIPLPKRDLSLRHNGHIFYIKCKNKSHRTDLINHLKEHKIKTVFHYIPLHTSEGGKKYSRFHGTCVHTTTESEKLLRLPLYPSLEEEQVKNITAQIDLFLNAIPC